MDAGERALLTARTFLVAAPQPVREAHAEVTAVEHAGRAWPRARGTAGRKRSRTLAARIAVDGELGLGAPEQPDTY